MNLLLSLCCPFLGIYTHTHTHLTVLCSSKSNPSTLTYDESPRVSLFNGGACNWWWTRSLIVSGFYFFSESCRPYFRFSSRSLLSTLPSQSTVFSRTRLCHTQSKGFCIIPDIVNWPLGYFVIENSSIEKVSFAPPSHPSVLTNLHYLAGPC